MNVAVFEHTLHALQVSGTCLFDAVLRRLHLLTLILELVVVAS